MDHGSKYIMEYEVDKLKKKFRKRNKTCKKISFFLFDNNIKLIELK